MGHPRNCEGYMLPIPGKPPCDIDICNKASGRVVQSILDVNQALRKRLSFKLVPTDDKELTCFFCHKTDCDHEFTYRSDDETGGRRTLTVGVHKECTEGSPYRV